MEYKEGNEDMKTKCWMCDREQYMYTEVLGFRVNKVIYENSDVYVMVPHDPHVRHHVMVVLKKHRDGLINCREEDLRAMLAAIVKCNPAFKRLGYDTVYTGVFSDNGHMHFHLFPLRWFEDKRWMGEALQWLAHRERESDENAFISLTDEAKLVRLERIAQSKRELSKAFKKGEI